MNGVSLQPDPFISKKISWNEINFYNRVNVLVGDKVGKILEFNTDFQINNSITTYVSGSFLPTD